MSCIAGLAVHPGSGPAVAWVDRMLADMSARAPQGLCSQDLGPVALGHALLLTSAQDQAPAWPLTLDGLHWIVADARIDARSELISGLRSHGRQVRDDAPHAELILHAYLAYGDAFLDHLIGDFAFALWDAPGQRLVCARDHFGVRPFVYAQRGGELAFASDVGALHHLPWVTDALDEVSLADFLLFGAPLDAHRTAFRDVQGLPPAGRLVWQAGRVTVDRYWQLPAPVDPRGWRMDALADAFLEVFSQAVEDRLPDGPLGCELSGGMDSSAIAVLATRHARAGASSITAYTHDLSRLEPRDEEGRLAGEIARSLGVGWVCQDMSRFRLFAPLGGQTGVPAEPVAYPLLEAHRENLAHASASGIRVMLSGDFGDTVLTPDTRYASRLRAGRRWGRMAQEALRHLALTGGLSGLGLRSALWPGAVAPPWEPERPDWVLAPAGGSVDLQQRWRLGWDQLSADLSSIGQLGRTWVGRSGVTSECLRLPVVFRYPFLDLRLVRLALQMPTGALAGKRVLRRALRGQLPPAILERPKTPAPGDYMRSLAARDALSPGLGADAMLAALGAFHVEVWQDRWQAWAGGGGAESTWSSHLLLAPLALESWIITRTQEAANANLGIT